MSTLNWQSPRGFDQSLWAQGDRAIYNIEGWGFLAGHKPWRVTADHSFIGEADTIEAAKLIAAAYDATEAPR